MSPTNEDGWDGSVEFMAFLKEEDLYPSCPLCGQTRRPPPDEPTDAQRIESLTRLAKNMNFARLAAERQSNVAFKAFEKVAESGRLWISACDRWGTESTEAIETQAQTKESLREWLSTWEPF